VIVTPVGSSSGFAAVSGAMNVGPPGDHKLERASAMLLWLKDLRHGADAR
jgi:hypothetical protein